MFLNVAELQVVESFERFVQTRIEVSVFHALLVAEVSRDGPSGSVKSSHVLSEVAQQFGLEAEG